MFGLADPPGLSLDHTLPAQSYTDTTPWGGSYWYWAHTAQGHYSQTVVAPAGTLAQYVGNGSFDLTITLTVAYTYTPAVPEPETWTMLVAGLGLTGWGRGGARPA